MSNSNWMSQLPAELHTVPLFNLAIPDRRCGRCERPWKCSSGSVRSGRCRTQHPVIGAPVPLCFLLLLPPCQFQTRRIGSHDSMSYDLDINSSIIEPDRLKRYSRIYCVRKTVRKWATTQEVSVTKQLDSGVRYLDLRIARKPNDTNPTRLYFYHGLYTRTDVETVFRDIHNWAQGHPKEILILSLSHFKGFDKNIEWTLHNHLINFIKNLFGSRLLHKTDNPTLKSCWDKGKNIIVSYDHRAYHQPALWRKIDYYYGNSMDTTKIQSKLCQVLEKERPSKCFFVCGLNLTLPDDARILKYVLRLCDNLANVIRRSLPRQLRWLNQQSDKTSVNIVASDLVTRDNFVSTVVKLNLKHVKA